MAKPLNPRQRRFVDAYLDEPNARLAALKAGYREYAARQTGYDLLQRQEVQAEIAARRAAQARRLTRAEVLNQLADVAYSNILDYARVDSDNRLVLDLSKLDRARAAGVRELTVNEVHDARRQVSRRTVRIRMGDKPAALRLLLANLPPGPRTDPI